MISVLAEGEASRTSPTGGIRAAYFLPADQPGPLIVLSVTRPV